MKHTDEEGDYIFTDKDRKGANIIAFVAFSCFGIIIFLGMLSSPSCQGIKKTPEEHFADGKHFVAAGEFYQAQKSFSNAIEKKHDYFDAYMERARAYEQTDSLLRSIADYDTLLTFKNLTVAKTAELYFLRANQYYLLSEDTLACHDYKKACDLNHNRSCDLIRKRCK
jgi:tetratricopeptide (TPR) repeat protein